ncbi:DUF218 domain [Actinomyces bovis]|uniref:DUF218 domain n=1 Tax=Actinomyces bovis TaxID=1658 RepID=A0ABY1VSX0_9ACTO|nr:YdcF family protein [Actinomyces bovis]SPT54133.1 DUF218 domain [Actinomyces bovis]VEG53621.1 DUF218 domain [Actinomyces israelii]
MLAASGATAWLLAEAAHSFASRAWASPPQSTVSAAHRAVVVLGHADVGTRAGAINQRRARHALRTLRSYPATRVVLSGGAVAGQRSEAELLEAELRRLGWRGELLKEMGSRTTWQNLANSLPLVQEAAEILLVSDPLHAAKARLLLRRQRPDLADRLRRACDHRLGESVFAKPGRALLGAVDLLLAAFFPTWGRDAQGMQDILRRISAYRRKAHFQRSVARNRPKRSSPRTRSSREAA